MQRPSLPTMGLIREQVAQPELHHPCAADQSTMPRTMTPGKKCRQSSHDCNKPAACEAAIQHMHVCMMNGIATMQKTAHCIHTPPAHACTDLGLFMQLFGTIRFSHAWLATCLTSIVASPSQGALQAEQASASPRRSSCPHTRPAPAGANPLPTSSACHQAACGQFRSDPTCRRFGSWNLAAPSGLHALRLLHV